MERGQDHWKDYRDGKETSHILKHHILHHGGEGEPKFHLRPTGFYRTALSRQISEAVQIKRRGGEESLLNSKAEYNRSSIARLTLPRAEPGKKEACKEGETSQKEAEEGEETLVAAYRKERKETWLKSLKTPTKRKGETQEANKEARGRKLKYRRIEEGWGEGNNKEGCQGPTNTIEAETCLGKVPGKVGRQAEIPASWRVSRNRAVEPNSESRPGGKPAPQPGEGEEGTGNDAEGRTPPKAQPDTTPCLGKPQKKAERQLTLAAVGGGLTVTSKPIKEGLNGTEGGPPEGKPDVKEGLGQTTTPCLGKKKEGKDKGGGGGQKTQERKG